MAGIVTSLAKRHVFPAQNGPKPVTTRHVEPAVQPVDADGLPVFDTERWRKNLPKVGDRAWVVDFNTGEPWRDRPGRVLERRGGVPRRGPDGKPRRPKVVEYLVDGYVNWYEWHQLIVDPEVYP